MTEAALVHDGELYLPSRSAPIQIGSTEWLEWLKSARKFRFSHSQGYEIQPGSDIISFRDLTFTAFRAGKNKPYWNAQRRKGGDLRTRYLGRDEDLTYETMVEVALLLDKGSTKEGSKQRTLKSVPLESHSSNYETEQEASSQNADEIAELKDELERVTQDRDSLLIRLGNGKIQASEDAQHRIKQLEARVTELDNANWELEKRYTQVDDLWYRSGQKRSELEARIAELENQEEELLNLQDENMRLQDENAKLKQKFEGLPEIEKEMREEINRLMSLQLENDSLKSWNRELRERLEANPSPQKLIQQYETDYETIKKSLPKPPKDLTRNWVEFWRFKTWLESR